MPERSTSAAHTSLTTEWGKRHLAISGVSHQPYVQIAHHSNAVGPGGSGMQDNGAGNYDTGVDFETLRQQWTGIAKKEAEIKDLREIRESISEYTENTIKFYNEATEFLNNWRNTPVSTTDPYNPPNATFGEASTSAETVMTFHNASFGTDNATFGNASVGTDNIAFGNASTSTRPLEEQAEWSKSRRKKALASVNGKQSKIDFGPIEVDIHYPNDQAVNTDPFIGIRSPPILKGKRRKMTSKREKKRIIDESPYPKYGKCKYGRMWF